MEFPRVKLEAGSSFFQIDSQYFEGSGLVVGGENFFLYLRREMKVLFKTLESVTKESGMVAVYGPPGCGKSCATYAFICTILDMGYIITWVHLYKQRYPRYVRFDNKMKEVGSIAWNKFGDLLDFDCQGKIHILILDGITKEGSHFVDVQVACNDWMMSDAKHRQIVVNSMSCPARYSADEERDYNLRRCPFQSWRIEEFKEAVKNAELLKQVEPKLDAHIDDEVLKTQLKRDRETPFTIDEKLESKFYFAGGSSRSMFDLTTKQVIDNVNTDVSRATNLHRYLSGEATERSEEAVNRLLTTYVDSSSIQRCKPISTFAALAIARKLGPQLMTELRTTLKALAKNPALDGIIWEMWVVSKLACDGLNLKEKSSTSLTWTRCVWESSPVLEIDPRGPKPSIEESVSTWLKPDHWQQGGYDLVHINELEKSLRFVQVTRGQTHTFKTEYFDAFLNQVKHIWGVSINYLEICFMISAERAQVFTISKPSYSGLFAEYQVLGKSAGTMWEKSSELEHVKICVVDE